MAPHTRFLTVPDSNISVLKIEGTQVTDTGKNLKLPGPPASLRAAPK